MIEALLIGGAVLLVGWIIATLVSTSRREGAARREVDQAREAGIRLRDATRAGIAARERDDRFGGLRSDDGHKRK